MMTDEQREEFRARWREQLAAAGPWSAEQRARVAELFIALRLRRARDAARAIAPVAKPSHDRAATRAPGIAASRESASETLNRDVSGHVKGGAP
jgi:hypothetical protein